MTSWTAACQAPLLFSGLCSNSCLLSRWCHPTISSSAAPLLLLPSIFPSIRVFSNESVLGIRWPRHWSFSFRISPLNEYIGFISFKIDWFDLLAVQGTLKSLLKHHNLKASILWCTDFSMVQCSHPYLPLKSCRPSLALQRDAAKFCFGRGREAMISSFMNSFIHPDLLAVWWGQKARPVQGGCGVSWASEIPLWAQK